MICDRCRTEYEHLFEQAKAEGYKAGFYEGFAVFQKEIALANAMRPIIICKNEKISLDTEDRSATIAPVERTPFL